MSDNSPPPKPIDFNYWFQPIGYGPPPRNTFVRPIETFNCLKCGILTDYTQGNGLCFNCKKEHDEHQRQLDQYMNDLIKWFRSVGWSYEQCKHALDEGFKVLK